MQQQNIGTWERRLRGVAAPILMAWGTRQLTRRGGMLGAVAALASGAMLGRTAMTGHCPLNRLVGRSSG